MTKQILKMVAVSAFIYLGAVAHGFSQSLIYEFKFNDSGVTTASTGSNNVILNMLNSSGTATDLHSFAGLGVSGQAGDLALNNSASTGMGASGSGGVAISSSNSMSGISSFTLTGWFYSDGTTIRNAARLVDDSSRFNLSAGGSGVLSLNVNSTSLAVSSDAAYLGVNQWVFFAVTYDGSVSTNNVSFYTGDLTHAVSQVGASQTYNQGAFPTNTTNIAIGNLNGGTYIRPFDGYLDDIRLYGATTGSGGVLSLSALEDLRQMDVVPEPSSQMLMLVGFMALLISPHFWRRSAEGLPE